MKEYAFNRKETILEEAIFELQSEIQARKNAEIDRTHLEACLNNLKLFLVEELSENDELKRQSDETLLKEDEILRRWALHMKTILEIESERRAREEAETEKQN